MMATRRRCSRQFVISSRQHNVGEARVRTLNGRPDDYQPVFRGVWRAELSVISYGAPRGSVLASRSGTRAEVRR